MDQPALRDFWHRAARRTALKLNGGWWVQAFAPLLVVVGVIAFAVIFWLRSKHVVLDYAWVAGAVAGGGVVAAVAAWVWARRSFVAPSAALVALESRLGLHNALTTAEAGRALWPASDCFPDDGFRWSWRWLGAPVAAAVACLAAALFLPVPQDAGAALPMTPPLAWEQMDSWLEKLEAEKVIDQAQLEELKQKLEELRAQPERDWFGHQSLEATDSLEQSLERSVDQLGRQLDRAERSLNALENYSDQLTAASKDTLAADFDAALEGLRSNELKLDPELMKKLSAIDPKNLKSVSAEQLKELREALEKRKGACKNCQGGAGQNGKLGFLGDGEGEDDEQMAALMKLIAEQDGAEGANPGNGGVTRGPGAAPLVLGDEESKLGTKNQEAVENPDLSRATPGDLIGLGEQKHDVDQTQIGPREAGDASTGQGGEQVWKESLTPDERAVLKRYFNRK